MGSPIANQTTPVTSAQKSAFWPRIVPWFVAMASLIVGWLAVGGRTFQLHVPAFYSGDGLFTLTLIKRLIENPWVFQSQALGYPFGASLYDYPIPDSGSLLFLKVIGIATHSAGAAYNIYYLLGFPLNALAAYYAFGRFGVSRTPFRAVGAFAFAVLPFHFMRMGHLLYTWYFSAPIFALFAYRIYQGQRAQFFKGRPWANGALYGASLLALSCFGVYYAFFGVLMLLTGGATGAARTRSLTPLIRSILATSVVTIGIVANVAPNLAYRVTHGVNEETAQRSAAESERYGLKIAQMLLPRPHHRFAPFAELNEAYSTTFPLVNENDSSAGGMIASAGFLILLLSVVLHRKKTGESDSMPFLASLALVMILFCTIGGFSSLFSLLISPMIRAWNRASVFVAFISVCAAMLSLDRLAGRYRLSNASIIGLAIALAGFAVWDQKAPGCGPCFAANKATFEDDARFVVSIENRLPPGSAVYQLPYMPFPEVPPLNKLQAYDQALGYLHSRSLKWSYGLMKGRNGDLFFRALSQESVQRQIDVIRKLGFRGVYLDRRGYTDGGVQIERALTSATGHPPVLISGSNQQVFFDLVAEGNNDAVPAQQGLTDRQIMERAGFVVDKLGKRSVATLHDGIDFSGPSVPTFLSDINGLSSPEPWGRWSDANLAPAVTLTFAAPLPKRFVLHIRCQGFQPDVGRTTKVTVGRQTRQFVPTPAMGDFALRFDDHDAANEIEIRPATPVSPHDVGMSADTRKLGVGLQRLWIETLP